MESAADHLSNAVEALYCLSNNQNAGQFMTVMETVNEAADHLSTAMTNKNLAHASRKELDNLKEQLQNFYNTYSRIENLEATHIGGYDMFHETIEAFPYSLKYLMEEVPSLLDIAQVQVSYDRE